MRNRGPEPRQSQKERDKGTDSPAHGSGQGAGPQERRRQHEHRTQSQLCPLLPAPRQPLHDREVTACPEAVSPGQNHLPGAQRFLALPTSSVTTCHWGARPATELEGWLQLPSPLQGELSPRSASAQATSSPLPTGVSLRTHPLSFPLHLDPA